MADAPQIAVLMAVHNGAPYLAAQIASLRAQSLPPRWLLIGDDASADGSRAVIASACEGWSDCEVSVRPGPATGHYAANFAALLSQVPEAADFAAFSDQDDVWLPRKLDRAVRALNGVPAERPALYGSASWICDTDLVQKARSRPFRISPSLRHALVQNYAGGNTMVFNRATLALAQRVLGRKPPVAVHDWWLYQLVTAAGGQAIYDPEPGVMYRQHVGNQIGDNGGFHAIRSRIADMLNGRYAEWNDQNLRALELAGPDLTDEARHLVGLLRELRAAPLPLRLRLLRQSGVHRGGLLGRVGLLASVLLRKF